MYRRAFSPKYLLLNYKAHRDKFCEVPATKFHELISLIFGIILVSHLLRMTIRSDVRLISKEAEEGLRTDLVVITVPLHVSLRFGTLYLSQSLVPINPWMSS
jgi:hypothetical protein